MQHHTTSHTTLAQTSSQLQPAHIPSPSPKSRLISRTVACLITSSTTGILIRKSTDQEANDILSLIKPSARFAATAHRVLMPKHGDLLLLLCLILLLLRQRRGLLLFLWLGERGVAGLDPAHQLLVGLGVRVTVLIVPVSYTHLTLPTKRIV
eukprot:TRINITY_DN23754_c0_g1_i12.p1 TRINITY_DN23754_c0_g1~~TRINITY_DN23754_c0_g1_i12.p1  ORF type:complete len:152 (-),score=6.99 TRINITY_DN23754_c0_g1_i12:139-594(-)